MAEGIVYLDSDDEITSAASRIRSATGTKVALVVPYGSRIATSRMNFRLLSREAVMNNRRLSIVAGDAASRSLAASAGLPVFASVAEYESAVAAPPSDPADGGVDASAGAAAGLASAGEAAPGPGLAASDTIATTEPLTEPASRRAGRKSQRPRRPPPDETTAIAVDAPAAAPWTGATSPAAQRAGAARAFEDLPDTADDRPSRLGRRVRAPVLIAGALVILALIVAAVGAYVFLPTASITLVPRQDAIAPIEITVSADPTASDVDVANAVVPAIRLEVPVEASDTFTTTGKHVEESAARGAVTFTNYDTSSGVSIPSGSIVSTEGGVRFRTQQTAVLQPASILPFAPTTDSVPIAAVKKGDAGNVPANTIRVVPQGQNPDLLKVNNPDPTSGGTHTETPEIKQGEVDKAIASLRSELQKAFDDAVKAGAGAPPDTTLFPETATLGEPTPSLDPKSLVGTDAETFDLGMTATGTVIAVDPRPVQTIAEAELASHVQPNHRLVEGSARIDVGEGTVGEDDSVTFLATARATQVAIVDTTALPALVKGRTPAEARAALAPYGDATISLWPDWVSTVTSVDARLSITVEDGDTSGPAPGPSASSRPGPSVQRTAPPNSSDSPVEPSESTP